MAAAAMRRMQNSITAGGYRQARNHLMLRCLFDVLTEAEMLQLAENAPPAPVAPQLEAVAAEAPPQPAPLEDAVQPAMAIALEGQHSPRAAEEGAENATDVAASPRGKKNKTRASMSPVPVARKRVKGGAAAAMRQLQEQAPSSDDDESDEGAAATATAPQGDSDERKDELPPATFPPSASNEQLQSGSLGFALQPQANENFPPPPPPIATAAAHQQPMLQASFNANLQQQHMIMLQQQQNQQFLLQAAARFQSQQPHVPAWTPNGSMPSAIPAIAAIAAIPVRTSGLAPGWPMVASGGPFAQFALGRAAGAGPEISRLPTMATVVVAPTTQAQRLRLGWGVVASFIYRLLTSVQVTTIGPFLNAADRDAMGENEWGFRAARDGKEVCRHFENRIHYVQAYPSCMGLVEQCDATIIRSLLDCETESDSGVHLQLSELTVFKNECGMLGTFIREVAHRELPALAKAAHDLASYGRTDLPNFACLTSSDSFHNTLAVEGVAPFWYRFCVNGTPLSQLVRPLRTRTGRHLIEVPQEVTHIEVARSCQPGHLQPQFYQWLAERPPVVESEPQPVDDRPAAPSVDACGHVRSSLMLICADSDNFQLPLGDIFTRDGTLPGEHVDLPGLALVLHHVSMSQEMYMVMLHFGSAAPVTAEQLRTFDWGKLMSENVKLPVLNLVFHDHVEFSRFMFVLTDSVSVKGKVHVHSLRPRTFRGYQIQPYWSNVSRLLHNHAHSAARVKAASIVTSTDAMLAPSHPPPHFGTSPYGVSDVWRMLPKNHTPIREIDGRHYSVFAVDVRGSWSSQVVIRFHEPVGSVSRLMAHGQSSDGTSRQRRSRALQSDSDIIVVFQHRPPATMPLTMSRHPSNLQGPAQPQSFPLAALNETMGAQPQPQPQPPFTPDQSSSDLPFFEQEGPPDNFDYEQSDSPAQSNAFRTDSQQFMTSAGGGLDASLGAPSHGGLSLPPSPPPHLSAMASPISPSLRAMTSPGLRAMASPGLGAMASPGLGAMASPGLGAMASPGLGAMASPGSPSLHAMPHRDLDFLLSGASPIRKYMGEPNVV